MSSPPADGALIDNPERADAVIRNRAGLVHALSEAAEVEHGLMVQYLFAAFSMRKGPQAGLEVSEVELLRRWEASILRVARDEMAHLGTVCNLLGAIGGAPHFRRAALPAPARYFPTEGGTSKAFTLEPFSAETIARFVGFEQPAQESLVPPDLDYASVGDLYRQIQTGFEDLDGHGGLFIGRPEQQDVDEWTAALKLHRVTNLGEARAAIASIVKEGESSDDPNSHWMRFKQIRDELEDALARPGFEPARPVLPNPLTRQPPGGNQVELVDHPQTKKVSELFNWVYGTVLLMLMRHYSYGDIGQERRKGLRDTIRRLMSGVIRPLAEILTELPAHDREAGLCAGPSFELYEDLRLADDEAIVWISFSERLAQASAACGELAGGDAAPARLGFIHQHLRFASREVDRLQALA